MAFLLAQGGDTLYKIDPATGTRTALTLPTGVTLSTDRKPKFAVLDQFVVMVNSPSRNLAIDPEGVVRVLVPRAPTRGPIVASGGAGSITGSVQAKCSFVVEGSDGTLLFESPLSPASVAVSLSSNSIAFSEVPVSTDSITKRRVYRNIAGGSVYYRVLDIDGNTGTAGTSTIADASLSLLPQDSSTLVAPPGTISTSRLRNIVSWKSRLWGVGSDPTDVDRIRFTESQKVYAWPNSVVAYPTGQDTIGVIGFAPRRDQLGVLKRKGLWQITGSASGSAGISTASVNIVQIQPPDGAACGCIAPDTIVVVNDRAYWLGDDGVWEWGPDGVKNISNEQVKPWFDRNSTYFNAARFPNAFARYNVQRNQVEFHLAAAGSSVEDRWVSFNLTTRCWYGPHKTAAFTPTHAALGLDENNLPISLVGGSDGVIYVANQSDYHDGTASAIDFDCYGPFHSGDAPDIEHHWGHLSVLTKAQTGALTITPYVGRLQALPGQAILHDMSKGREQLRRVGEGALARLRFRQAVVDQGCGLYGYEIDPVFEIGRR